jgi:L-aspartate oxidase
MDYKYDFLIVGSGIAGLSCALKVAEHGKVAIITKSEISDSNTNLAQGGIAAVMFDDNDIENHIEDTLIAGSHINNRDVVEIVVKEAKEQINNLLSWGVDFDKKTDGSFDFVKEGGHSSARILHHKDNTGYEIEKSLCKMVKQHLSIDVFEHWFALDIITQHHLGVKVTRAKKDIECYGIYALDINNNQIHTFLSKQTLIATGGIGNIYQNTTNPEIATGDGIAMVYRAKGLVKDMEFVQFHPTALYNPDEYPSFLITEAMRGIGSVLKNHKYESFMEKYDSRGSLAPRDVVAKAIDNEMKLYGIKHVYLDCTHIDPQLLISHFPNIHQKCLLLGIDITKDYIPVVPAAHYLCGGILVNKNGESSISNLYASGEVACTGLHGANRLASNSLIEALVFSNRIGESVISKINKINYVENIPKWNDDGTCCAEELILITQSKIELQQIMSNYVGIVRSDLRLKRAFARLELLYQETEMLYKKTTVSQSLCELRNAINVAYLIIKMANQRKESIGLHYNLDYD